MRLLLALLAAALIGCPGSDDDDSTPVVDAELILVIPADGTSDVPITQDVTAEWTAPVEGVVFAVTTDGAEVPGNVLARQYGVGVTPTLLFLDSRGRELTARLRGINTPEFFGFYVDRGIERARQSASKRESR